MSAHAASRSVAVPHRRVADRARAGRTVRAGRGFSVRVQGRTLTVCLGLLVALVAVVAVSLTTGDYPISVPEVLKTLAGQGRRADEFIVLGLRLPRVATGLLVGFALGVAGAVFQLVTRNPLGSPDVIGFTSGAVTGALVVLLVLGGGGWQTSFGALVGGGVTAIAVYLLSTRGGVQGYRLILVGIGVSAVLQAANSYLLTRSRVEDAQAATVWITGSLNGRGWEQATPVGVGLALLLPVLLLSGRSLTVLDLGDDAARALGVDVARTRLVVLVAATALTALAAMAAGPIAFVALAAPQIARRLTRAVGSGLVAAGLTGALVLLVSDLTAQRLFAPTQLPVGVVTGAVGGVYLAWLLVTQWRRGRG
ncbi:FecCD family ABC transporter permease [Kineococcus rhizosphaerae]|uniref:Iron complex transport system permease protein n=1 Tax=Kineococcus rhizosphaerae TaxID=559628 RepID=A0A2T0QZ08_9ACTN|nr:iron chelate uptake ABC transporter family permease subunit [Kineococcus rhizosphaerae]PRY11732.1 iron complex transport system permease protein [Kineococcus rhizosphaerae]